MFTISSNIDRVIGYTARIHPQFQFAAALALTRISKAIQADMPAAVEQAFDRPNEYTKNGTYVTPARKDNLVSVMGFKDKQAKYLGYQVRGGSRAPNKLALRLPTAVQLDNYGNIPRGTIKQLVERAKAGKRTTTRQAKRLGVSRELDLFYGDPKDGRPAGIYKRVVISADQHQLIPLIVFPRRSAQYRPRFNFYKRAEDKARAIAAEEIRRAWQQAIRSAR